MNSNKIRKGMLGNDHTLKGMVFNVPDINKILKKEIELIEPDKKTFKKINNISKNFSSNLKKLLKLKKIKAEVFVGGSLAKNTLIKKNKHEKYDIDIFIRFDKKYEKQDISKILGKILKKKVEKIHGSRDYYQLIIDDIRVEVIPVLKIKNPKQAENVTDLSYFHVNYVLNKNKKNKKISNEIKLAKVFAYSQNCYGAESYIHGFSGYALELLICHYKSFFNFIKNIAETKNNEKIIIDDSKFYKKKENILMELNESKQQSPIILIDPTFKERNALAGLSFETFEKFKKACIEFLKNPSYDFFVKKNVLEELKKKHKNIIIISIKTNKQKGDISGTKSKKFYDFFIFQLKKEFIIKVNEFNYNDEKNLAYFYLVLNKKQNEIIKGPPATHVENLTRFKKAHANAFIKNEYAFAEIEHNLSFENFFKIFLEKNKKIMTEMGIKEIRIEDNKK